MLRAEYVQRRVAWRMQDRGSPIILRRFSVLPGLDPLPNPATVVNMRVVGNYAVGAKYLSFVCEVGRGRLIPGDVIRIFAVDDTETALLNEDGSPMDTEDGAPMETEAFAIDAFEVQTEDRHPLFDEQGREIFLEGLAAPLQTDTPDTFDITTDAETEITTDGRVEPDGLVLEVVVGARSPDALELEDGETLIGQNGEPLIADIVTGEMVAATPRSSPAVDNRFDDVPLAVPLTSPVNDGSICQMVWRADTTVYANVSSFAQRVIDGSRVLASDLNVSIATYGAGPPPTTSDRLIIMGREYAILSVQQVVSNNRQLLWAVHAR